jgi:N utilization substance protein A
MNDTLAATLAASEIRTRDDLAELGVDELIEIAGLEEEEAGELIMAARAHWFEDEEAKAE